MTVLAVTPTQILADHWYVLVIGLLFFLWQVYNCLRFSFRMRRHQRELSKLLLDLDDGGTGRDVEVYAGDIPWLKWVDAIFPQDSSTPSNFTRDDILNELDTQIGSDGRYLMLQRTGIMAPLLGVIITVVGFIFAFLNISDSEDRSLADILMMVTPLVAGVGTGALLAFINQWLLHFVSGKVEAVRNSARAWFDAAIWSGVGLDIQAATVKAITAMERMARSVTQTAEQQEQTAEGLRESIGTIRDTSQEFQKTYASFGGEVEQLPARLSELTGMTTAAVETIQAMIPVGERAISGLDVSVAAFRSAVESNFVEAAKSHQTATETLVDSVGRISESTNQLKVSSGDLQDTVNAHTNSFKNLNRSLNKQVLPAHEAFLAAISQFNGRAEGLLERVDELHNEMIQSIGQITSLAPDAAEAIAGFSASSNAFSDAVQNRFTPAADEHRENTDRLSASIDQLQKSTRGLADGESAAGNLVRLQTRLTEDLGVVQESLRLAVDRLAETGTDLNQSLVDDVAPSQRSLREAAKSVSESATRLSLFVQKGVDPATKRLYRLDETLQRLNGTVDAIQDFSGARKDIEHLGQSLSRAAAVSDAIGSLPEQIRKVLEEVARTHQKQVDTQTRGGMMGWLRGRRESH